MKNCMVLVLLLLGMLSIKAQGGGVVPLFSDCGLTYFYDANGNRILRTIVPCVGGGSNKPQTASGQTSGISQSDTSVLASLEIVVIAPNPTKGPFNLSCNQDLDNANVTILDMNGKVMSQTTVSGRNVPLDISNLSPGSYEVIVTTKSNTTVKGLVKSKD
jgi:hypothetical protein